MKDLILYGFGIFVLLIILLLIVFPLIQTMRDIRRMRARRLDFEQKWEKMLSEFERDSDTWGK